MRRLSYIITLIILAAMVGQFQPLLVFASINDQPPPLPGWTHSPRYSDDTPGQHGIVLDHQPIVRSSPVIAEIDGNVANHKEVAVVTRDGFLYAYRADGSRLWPPVPLLPSPCSYNEAIDSIGNSNPAVGELLGDGVPYILVGYGTVMPSNCDGGIVAVNGATGQIAWRFSLRQWQQQQGYGAEPVYSVVGSVALADADGDGKMEIAFGGFDRNLYLLSAVTSTTYTVRWYYHAGDTIWATPIFYNIDNDPELELIAATDISANPEMIPPTEDGGFLYAFDTAARTPVRIEIQTGYLWSTFFDQALYSSPAIGDVWESNPGAEIVIGAGCYFPTNSPTRRGRWVKIINPRNGNVLQTLNAPECVSSSPALGDIDGDGKLEVVVNVGSGLDNGIVPSEVVAWDPENPNPKWRRVPFCANGTNVNDPYGGDLQSPVIADINGDGILEVLTANFWSVVILRGYDGLQLTCNGSGCGATPSLFAWFTVKSTPAVGDVNGDNILDVVIGGAHIYDEIDNSNRPPRAHLYAWTNLVSVFPPQTPPPGYQRAPAYSAPWPQFRRSPTNDGIFALPGLQAATTDLLVLTDGSRTETFEIELRSRDGSTLNLSLSESGDSQNIVSATLSRTTVSSTTPSKIVITVNASRVANGVYPVRLTVSAPNASAVTITIRVQKVARLYRTFVPITIN